MKILMLGNGFDLYHKLPTTYRCFLLVANFLQNATELPKNIAAVFVGLTGICDEINTSYNTYKEFYEGYSFDDADKQKLHELKSTVENNMWFRYFWEHYNVDGGWIDFEKEISYVLSLFLSVLELKKDRLFLQHKAQIQYPPELLAIRGFEQFYTTVYGDSYGYFKKKYVYSLESKPGMYSVDDTRILHDLYNDLICFKKALQLYLTFFVEKPLTMMCARNAMEKNDCFGGFDNVITFNYTNTYETLYGNPSIHYIHGKLDADIVLGVNPDEKDELQNMDISCIMFKKYYQRVLYRTDNTFVELISNLNKNKEALSHLPNELVICGHSLDETDKDIIEALFACSDRIYIVCHKLSKIGSYISNLVKIYGKTKFDEIRSRTQLSFISYDEWKNVNYFCNRTWVS